MRTLQGLQDKSNRSKMIAGKRAINIVTKKSMARIFFALKSFAKTKARVDNTALIIMFW